MDGVMLGIIIFLAIAGPTSGSTGGAIRTVGGAHVKRRVTPTASPSRLRVGGNRCGPLVGATAATGAAALAEVKRSWGGPDLAVTASKRCRPTGRG